MKQIILQFVLLLSLLCGIEGCHRATKQPVAAVPAPAPKAANAPTESTAIPPLRAPSGKVYGRVLVPGTPDEEPVVIPPLAPNAAPSQDNYHGVARKAAKLSIASGQVEPFGDIGGVLDSLVPDDQMIGMDISKGADSGRLPQEQRQVTVSAFLYAVSREKDNDFHCIMGLDPSQPARYMNVEVSGLPPSISEFFAQLKAVRDAFKAFFLSGDNSLPEEGYQKFDPPIPVRLTGSLFFDVDHKAGVVGPQGMRPETAWEIHPVSDIQFEPAGSTQN